MARKKYACDFETTTKKEDCRVWSWGSMEIGNKYIFHMGNTIDTFMDEFLYKDVDLYFHNLKFDGEFIVSWLLKNGWKYGKDGKDKTFNVVISNMNQWYVIDICYGYTKAGKKKHTKIYDSLKRLPFPIKKIAKDFKLPILKGEIDYEKERPVGYKLDEEEISYLRNDVEILARALEIQQNQGMKRMTAGSNALSDLKNEMGRKEFDKHFPKFSLELNDEIRKAYKGGFTWLNRKYKNVDLGVGVTYDVNSLYPSEMYKRKLPYGLPKHYVGEYVEDKEYDLYIQHISFGFELKKDKIPTIQIKNSLNFMGNEYLESSEGDIVDLWLTNIDLELIKEHYELYDVTYHWGWKFKSKIGMFNKFIDKWTYVKTTSEGAVKLLAKLMMNSSYGKFATNPNVTGRYPELNEDGSLSLKMQEEEEFTDPVYTPVGVFITSWARYTTISTAQKVYPRFVYADTDSIHLLGNEVPENIKDIIDDKKLGFWASEGHFLRARYLRQKTYIQEVCVKIVNGKEEVCTVDEMEKTKLKITCSGMPDRVKYGESESEAKRRDKDKPLTKVNFDNFYVGFTSYGKLVPKHVDGGVILEDSMFTIKKGV